MASASSAKERTVATDQRGHAGRPAGVGGAGTPPAPEGLLCPVPRDRLRGWWALLTISLGLLGAGAVSLGVTLSRGIGAWGVTDEVPWGIEIATFVFWLGIAHAGSLLSAVLLLLRRRWRGRIHRVAETVSVLSIACAAVIPIAHLGRPWLVYWSAPYPNSRGPLWVGFQSPLTWDAFAIGVYLLVSLTFWYAGLLPDLGALSARVASARMRRLLSLLALRWTGSLLDWRAHRSLMDVLAVVVTATFLATSTIVSLDFALTPIPGWRAAVLPLYFLGGAIHTGVAFVLAVLIAARSALRLGPSVSREHLEKLAKLLIATTCLMAALFAIEATGLLSGSEAERRLLADRACGPLAWAFWSMLVLSVAVPGALAVGRVRRSPGALFAIAAAVVVGMWLERLVLVVTPLQRGFGTGDPAPYSPTLIEVGFVVGSLGLFLTGLLLLARLLP
ncbi:MAG: NrfD/PsrC family molybdoenzyme membrane anchor subunit, partial [Myxococcales bacterium]